MFTGIIEKTSRVLGIADGPRFRRFTLANDWTDIKHGESIAINGCCLTVAELPPGEIGFDVISETLEKTNLGILNPGDRVNVERSIRVGDRLSGHFVQGHIDGVAKLSHIAIDNDQWRLTLQAPTLLAKYLVPKGSVTIDGVSLTIAAVNGAEFDLALIPTTVNLTTLTEKQPGWPYNLEADIMAKTTVAFLEHYKLLNRK